MSPQTISSVMEHLCGEPLPVQRSPANRAPPFTAHLPSVRPAPAAAPSHAQPGTQNNQRPRTPASPRRVTRERSAMSGSGERAPASASDTARMDGCIVLPEDRQQEHSGEDDSQPEEGLGSTDATSNFDTEALLDLLPVQAQSGVFEVILPGGETLAVLTDLRESLASFLLAAGSDRLREILLGKRMELEKGLAQRMGRSVRLAVL
ncbi:hypothetical protein [Herbaspirillum huttiense]|uniref:Uncharacterized protein n=1 Tax=Herbaspirillum huttiense subsp. lycopersici TaxID=3074428 RepID=A0ABU2ET29_9BURK|nr:hypothetical protein [Herbaspirillum huttiense]MDR9851319.1 hypothetical protein [Herbaspirillum huttiense SE1]